MVAIIMESGVRVSSWYDNNMMVLAHLQSSSPSLHVEEYLCVYFHFVSKALNHYDILKVIMPSTSSFQKALSARHPSSLLEPPLHKQ